MGSRAVLVGVFAILAGCASSPPPPEERPAAPERRVPLDSVTQLVPLDAADDLELPEALRATIAAATGRVPRELTPAQATALEDLESRYERLEAEAADESGMSSDRGRSAIVLASYFWDRLRLFSPDLEVLPPEDLVTAFESSGGRRE